MTGVLRRLAFVGALVAASSCGNAPSVTTSEDAPAPVTLSRSELHELESVHVQDTFRVSIALPSSYRDSEENYPVVYALDANAWAWFGSYSEIARVAAAVEKLPEVIVVGVGYTGATSDVLARRARDMTPVRSAEQEARIRDTAPDLPDSVVTGGADAFSRFMREELTPFVESRYRVDSTKRVLFGHSFGGLFALHVLFGEPAAFTDYIIGSPSIWYGDLVSFAKEQAYADEHDDLPVRVFLTVGSLEERTDDARSREFAMVSNVVELARRLDSRGYPGLELETVVFDGETHNGVIPPTFSRGIRYVFR